MEIIPYGRQDISKSDVEAIIDVLKSDFLTQGPAVPRFEKSVADYCSVKHAVAVNSATSALHIACLALNVGQKDIVWTTPISFVASANCALYCGASVDFVDIDNRTYNLNIELLEEKLVHAKKSNKLPKVLIPVHLCGQSCNMEKIKALSYQYGFKIIEDASHAIGAKYKGQSVGSCAYSDITVFSFHPVKIITTGEGGMAVTNNRELAQRMYLLRSHGISRIQNEFEKFPKNEIRNYKQIFLGFNYRMTDIQAALGSSQLLRLDEFVSKRRYLAKRYDDLLDDVLIAKPWQDPECSSCYHLYVIRLKLDKIHKTQRQVYEEMQEAGILVNLHYIPIYKQPYYMQKGFKSDYCKEAEKYYSEAISIPLYSSMTENQQDRVIKALKEVVR